MNARLAEEERSRGDGDPFYPKLQWPTAELCALCRAPVLRGAEAADPQWNEGEVARFLVKFFSAPPGTVLQRPQAAQKPKHAWGRRKHLARRVIGASYHAPRALHVVVLLAAALAIVLAVARRRSSLMRTSKNAVL